MKPTLTFLTALLLVSLATLDAADSERGGTVPAYPPVFQTEVPYRFSGLESRAVTPENPTGAKGMGGKDRGNGNLRKGAPAFRNVRPGETKTLCDIEGPGMIRHIWITVQDRSPVMLRNNIVRIYWDDSPHPSVEVPLGDLFGVGLTTKQNGALT
jgi:hypothetical protein